MPFVSEAQRRKCYLMQREANEKGLISSWDCKKFGEEKQSSRRRSRRKSKPNQSTPKKAGTARADGNAEENGQPIYVGPKGGKYVIRKNKKVYL